MSEILGGQALADEPFISRGEIPSPAPQPGSSLSGHLQDLTDRARSYVAAASSIKTRKPTHPIGSIFLLGAVAPVFPPSPTSADRRSLYHSLRFGIR
jgi:hypothetical protein